MVDNLVEALQADTSFANVSVEEADSNDDVGQFAQLGDLLGGCEGHKGTQTSSGED